MTCTELLHLGLLLTCYLRELHAAGCIGPSSYMLSVACCCGMLLFVPVKLLPGWWRSMSIHWVQLAFERGSSTCPQTPCQT